MTKGPETSSVWFRRSPQILKRISSSKTCRLVWFQSWHGFSSIWGALFFNQSAWPSYLKFLKVSSELFFVSRASRWPTRRWGTFWGGSNLNHKFILVKKLENDIGTSRVFLIWLTSMSPADGLGTFSPGSYIDERGVGGHGLKKFWKEDL